MLSLADLLERIQPDCSTCLDLASQLEPKNGFCTTEQHRLAIQAARDNLEQHLKWGHSPSD